MSKNLNFNINLFTEGENFFDILKAFIRDYKDSQWPHERERKAFAEKLFLEALKTYEEGIKADEMRLQTGLEMEQDLIILSKMKDRFDYWTNKFEEVSGKEYDKNC